MPRRRSRHPTRIFIDDGRQLPRSTLASQTNIGATSDSRTASNRATARTAMPGDGNPECRAMTISRGFQSEPDHLALAFRLTMSRSAPYS